MATPLDPRYGLVFDLETTGCKGASQLDGSRHRILQFAAQRVSDPTATFVRDVRPGCHIPAASTACHGITDERVQGAPSFEVVMAAFRAWLASHGLATTDPLWFVAHNGFAFDAPLWRRASARTDVPLPSHWRWVDTMKLCRSRYDLLTKPAKATDQARWEELGDNPKATPNTLSRVHLRLVGEVLVGAHDAGADVAGLARIFERLRPHLAADDVRTIVDPSFPSDAPLYKLSGVGAPKKPPNGYSRTERLATAFRLPVPTIGALRAAMADLAPPQAETKLRSLFSDDDVVLGVLAAGYDRRVDEMLVDFPYTNAMPGYLTTRERERLASAGHQTLNSCLQYLLYDAQGDPARLRSFLDLEPTSWRRLWRQLHRDFDWKCDALKAMA